LRRGRLDFYFDRVRCARAVFFFFFTSHIRTKYTAPSFARAFGHAFWQRQATTPSPPTHCNHARRRYENNNFYILLYVYVVRSRAYKCISYSVCAPIYDYWYTRWFIYFFNVVQKTCSHTHTHDFTVTFSGFFFHTRF